jgi:hypothetical protein
MTSSGQAEGQHALQSSRARETLLSRSGTSFGSTVGFWGGGGHMRISHSLEPHHLDLGWSVGPGQHRGSTRCRVVAVLSGFALPNQA